MLLRPIKKRKRQALSGSGRIDQKLTGQSDPKFSNQNPRRKKNRMLAWISCLKKISPADCGRPATP